MCSWFHGTSIHDTPLVTTHAYACGVVGSCLSLFTCLKIVFVNMCLVCIVCLYAPILVCFVLACMYLYALFVYMCWYLC